MNAPSLSGTIAALPEAALSTDVSALDRRSAEIFEQRRTAILRRTDRWFAWLMLGQWLFGILVAVTYSPYAWAGRSRSIHEHVYAAVLLGGLITALPVLLTFVKPGEAMTRYVIATAQMLWSGLLIHLTGGRIETHFHVFGSLAFLSFYRDWKVLIPATVVVAGDHVVRQLLWPESVYGIANPESWRFLEHSFWVVFENVFLVLACIASTVDLRTACLRQAEVESLSARERAKSEALDRALAAAVSAQQQAEHASQVKSQFLANMSHEVRTPLNGVLGMTELLLRSALNERQHRYVETLKASGAGLLTVINDILDFSKIEAGKLDLQRTDFDVGRSLNEVGELMSAVAQHKGIELLCHMAPGAPRMLMGDPDRLRQVLCNLVSNAIKFTAQGKVELSAQVDTESTEAVSFRFQVKDTGIGIAEEDQRALFQPFTQVDPSHSRRFGGTGLGLAISKQLVAMMGGEIGIVSELGRGSTFWFVVPFPRSSVELSAERHDHVQAHATPRDKLVLVADDNAVNREVASELLRELGYEVETATNGTEVLQMARDKAYAAILMDCQMPELNGYDAARAFRSTEHGARTPIIAVTAHAMAGERERVIEAGMDDYLAKPFSVNTLAALMRRWVEPVPAAEARLAVPLDGRGAGVLSARTRRSAKVAGLFLGDLPRRLSSLQQSVQTGARLATKEEAHRLRGSSVSIGALGLAEALGALELAEASEARGALARVEAEAEAVRLALVAELALVPVATSGSVRQ